VTDDTSLVQCRALTKRFGSNPGIEDVDLDVRPGEVVGLIGRNGSGKTTLLRHVPGILLPTSGSCRTFGREAGLLSAADLARLGYVDQEGDLIPFLTVGDHIDYVRAYYSNWNATLQRRYLQRFDIPPDARVGGLSPGVRQQLAVLLAVCFEPELLVLDEPAAAMDPLARSEFLMLLAELIQDEHRAIVLSSHILSDVERVVDRIVILDEGHVIRDTPLDDLRDSYRRVRLTSMTGRLPTELGVPGTVETKRDVDSAVVTVRDVTADRIERVAAELGCTWEILPLSLEEIYRFEVARQDGGR
jgi:ABC-2 type transport system ATP-binding protein